MKEIDIKILTDYFACLDMFEAGFVADYLGKVASDLRPGEWLYVFNNSAALSAELSSYPSSTYLP